MNNNTIAVVAGHEITEADFEAFTKGLPADQQQYLQNPDAIEFFKKQFVSLYLFAEMGKEEKLDETDEFKTTLQNIKRDMLGQMAMRKVLENITITDEEAQTYYDTHTEMFQKSPTVHAKHILMDSEDSINNILDKINNNELSFEEAAKNHSTCPSGQQGGDLGEFGRGQMVPEFEAAAFEAELNKIVGPIKTQFGYHLIKVENRQEASTASYDEVKDSVKANLMRQKQQQIIDEKEAELRAKYCK